MTEDLQLRGEMLANGIASAASDAAGNDPATIESLVTLATAQADIRRVTVSSPAGRHIIDRISEQSRQRVLSNPEDIPDVSRLLVVVADVADPAATTALARGAAVPPGQVRIELSRDRIVASTVLLGLTAALLLGISVIVVVAIAIPGGRWIARPLRQLVALVEELQRGNLSARARQQSRGLVGDLEHRFNALARAIHDSQEHLLQRAQRSTLEARTSLAKLEEHNAELESARRKAMESSRLKSEFLANMSHEIRTPMNGILGFLELLEQTDLDTSQKAYLGTVRGSANHLLNLLNDILDSSKIEAGKLELRAEPFSLRGSLEEAVGLFAVNAEDKGLQLSLDVDPGLPGCYLGDSPRLVQVISNLVSNAIKFTERGRVHVQVDRCDGEDRQQWFRIAVSDTGIGIAEVDRQKLFGAFAQLDSSVSRRRGGTGLGLTISRHLVTLMGGTIELQSNPGKGSCFAIRLALPEVDAADDAESKSAVPTGQRVWLVSDDPILARGIDHQLQWLGAVLKVVPSQQDPSLLTELQQPLSHRLCVLIDAGVPVDLPKLVTRWTSRRPGGTEIALLLLGGYGQTALGATPLENVDIAFAAKPPRTGELVRLIDHSDQGGPPGARHTPSVHGMEPAEPPRGMRVLLADDNPVNRRLAGLFLHQLGAIVDEVNDGQDAVAACETSTYEVILMDLHMPHVDGTEATMRIRQLTDNSNATAPIVALTADATEADKERLLQLGMDDLVTKPITQQALRTLLCRWHREHLGEDRFGTAGEDHSDATGSANEATTL